MATSERLLSGMDTRVLLQVMLVLELLVACVALKLSILRTLYGPSFQTGSGPRLASYGFRANQRVKRLFDRLHGVRVMDAIPVALQFGQSILAFEALSADAAFRFRCDRRCCTFCNVQMKRGLI